MLKKTSKPRPARPWQELRAEVFTPAQIATQDDEIRRELSLIELREKMGRTQVELAEALAITQSSLSKFEHGEDPRYSTLREYVGALGGELRLAATVGGVTYSIILPASAAAPASRRSAPLDHTPAKRRPAKGRAKGQV